MKTGFCGVFRVPGDKSLSHRVLMLAALSQEVSQIKNFLQGNDCLATKNILSNLGVSFWQNQDILYVKGVGPYGFLDLKSPLNCVNSGTTMRLLMGLLCTQKISCELTGLPSLLKRPISPLS